MEIIEAFIMLRFLVISVALASFLPLLAGTKVRTSILNPKDIAQGWLLLFDGQTSFGWQPMPGSRWGVQDGCLQAASEKGQPDVIVTTAEFGDYQLEFDFKARRGGQAQIQVGTSAHVKAFPIEENAALPPGRTVEVLPLEVRGNLWHHASLTVKAGVIVEHIIQSRAFKSLAKAHAFLPKGLRGHIALAGNGLSIKNLKLKPLDMKSLFNGKDLTGWKIYPGKKSKFLVNDLGELTVIDGPGDLQTEGKYGDFLLQLKCRSNGKHLNSGVFFRCRAGEYQNGYEAQIRNQFTHQPRQEYTIEHYDPVTHKLANSKKIKFQAVDYGTGAIYRRQPARFQASSDGKWFTLTILAHGNHFATWVNGLQVTDWTDNRPPSDNARTGLRREPGHISLQGHDPTTNLSFRNFRIAELPVAARGQ